MNTETDLIQIREIQDKDLGILGNINGPWEFQKKGSDYLKWLTSYQQTAFYVAIFNNEIIGYFGAHSVPLKLANRTVSCYRGEVFIHPEHRKKWYSFLTFSRLHDIYAKNEIRSKNAVFYGFPIRKLMPYYENEQGGRRIKAIPRYIRILDIDFVLNQRIKNKKVVRLISPSCRFFWRLWYSTPANFSEDIAVKEIRCFDKRFDDLWRKASQNHEICVVRNAKYLNWRYIDEPENKHVVFSAERNNEVVGYIVLKRLEEKDQGKGCIIDLLDIQDKQVTQSLLWHSIRYFESNHANKVEFYLTNDYYENVLRSAGFIQRPNRPVGADWFMATSYSSNLIDEKYFYDPKNWFMNSADKLLS